MQYQLIGAITVQRQVCVLIVSNKVSAVGFSYRDSQIKIFTNTLKFLGESLAQGVLINL